MNHNRPEYTGSTAVQEMEERYRVLIDNLAVGFAKVRVIFDSDHQAVDLKIQEVNQALTGILGLNREQCLEKTLTAIYPTIPPAMGEMISAFGKAASSGRPYQFEYRAEKTQVWISISLRSVGNDQVIATVEDISERRKTEDLLKEREKRFREFIEFLPEIMFEMDLRGNVTFANQFALKAFRYPKEDYSSVNLYDYVVPEDKERVGKNISRIAAGESVNKEEYTVIREDGSRFPVMAHIGCIRDQLEKITGFRGILVDISRRKHIEEELRESEKRFRRVFEDGPIGMVIVDTGMHFLKANAAFCDILGYTEEELKKLTFVDVSHPEHAKTDLEQVKKLYRGEIPLYQTQKRYLKKDGTIIWGELHCLALRDADGAVMYFLSIIENITERKKMEEKIVTLYETEKQQRQELQEEAKARGLFINVLAHELRTPLTPILASTAMLKDLSSDQLDNLAKRLAGNIYNSTQTLSRRLEELLDLARCSRGTFKLQKQPTDVCHLIEGAISRFKPSLDHLQQRLKVDLSSNIPVIEIDPARFEQVILNLLSNASKFSPEKSTIKLKALVENGGLIIEVKDKGIGLSPEEQQRLFQPYHRVEQDRQKFPGIGLGLAICKQIIEAHGGDIKLTSKLGQGSIFSIVMPIIIWPDPQKA